MTDLERVELVLRKVKSGMTLEEGSKLAEFVNSFISELTSLNNYHSRLDQSDLEEVRHNDKTV